MMQLSDRWCDSLVLCDGRLVQCAIVFGVAHMSGARWLVAWCPAGSRRYGVMMTSFFRIV